MGYFTILSQDTDAALRMDNEMIYRVDLVLTVARFNSTSLV